MGYVNRFFLAIYIIFLTLNLFGVPVVYAGGYPIISKIILNAKNCHNVHGDQPKLIWEQPAQTDTDHTASNQLCWSCHNESYGAPVVLTHSNLRSDPNYGHWMVECVVCHAPHFQVQALTYTSESLYQGWFHQQAALPSPGQMMAIPGLPMPIRG